MLKDGTGIDMDQIKDILQHRSSGQNDFLKRLSLSLKIHKFCVWF